MKCTIKSEMKMSSLFKTRENTPSDRFVKIFSFMNIQGMTHMTFFWPGFPTVMEHIQNRLITSFFFSGGNRNIS